MTRLRADDAFRDLLFLAVDPPRVARGSAYSDPDAARDVLRVLTCGELARDGIEKCLESAVDDEGAFVPPLRLFEGELSFPFEPLDVLRALKDVAGTFRGERAIDESLAAANDVLASPWPRAVRGAIETLRAALAAALARPTRGATLAQIDADVERMLLEARRYQRRSLLGAMHLQAFLTPKGGAPVPLYLPEMLAHELPLLAAFDARVLAEVRPRQDMAEASPVALSLVALGRLLSAR